MIKRFNSQHAHTKYRPHQSRWKRFSNWRKKRKQKRNTLIDRSSIGNFRKNPFNREKKKSRLLSFKVKIIFFFILLIGWAIMLLYLPYFKITDVRIEGLHNIKDYEITSFLNKFELKQKKILPSKNYFLVKTDRLESRIQKNFPIMDVTSEKVFPNKLIISIKEKVTSLIYDNSKSYYLMDNNGSLIKKLTEVNSDEFVVVTSTTSVIDIIEIITTTKDIIHIPNDKHIKSVFGTYPILYDKRKKDVSLNDSNIIQMEYILSIIKFDEIFNQGTSGKIKYYEMELIGSGIKAVTKNRWDVYFDPLDNIEQQIKSIETVINKNDVLLYIDTRQQEKIFWK